MSTIKRGKKVPGWDDPEACPKCLRSFKGKPIPAKDRRHFGPGATHFNLATGIYSMELDRTVAWRCPFCRHEWPLGR